MPEDFRVSQGPTGAPVITFSTEKSYRYILERKDPGAGEFEKNRHVPGERRIRIERRKKGMLISTGFHPPITMRMMHILASMLIGRAAELWERDRH